MADRDTACRTKVRHATWDAARLAGLAVWQENPREGDANPPTPYLCDIRGEPHYHCGHYRSARDKRWNKRRKATT